MEYWTSQEVAKIESVTAPIAQKWARENGVVRLSDRYLWTREDLEGFQDRNKGKGRPKKEVKDVQE